MAQSLWRKVHFLAASSTAKVVEKEDRAIEASGNKTEGPSLRLGADS